MQKIYTVITSGCNGTVTVHLSVSSYFSKELAEEVCIDHNIDAPAYNIQSFNPVGRENIRSIIDGWHQFYINNNKRISNENNTTYNTQSTS